MLAIWVLVFFAGLFFGYFLTSSVLCFLTLACLIVLLFLKTSMREMAVLIWYALVMGSAIFFLAAWMVNLYRNWALVVQVTKPLQEFVMKYVIN